MKKIGCMIVEDEPASREILQRYIRDYEALHLVSVCHHALEAIEELRTKKVDLMFLDITMPKLSGLEFYRTLKNPPPVIFTTAYPQYAVEGFEVNAIDYLVKPFAFERFLKAMNKFLDLQTRGSDPEAFVLLQADKKTHKVNCDQILYAEAMGDYVKVNTVAKTLVVHLTLQKLEAMLPENRFYRVHKSYLICLSRIDYIEGNMVIINKERIPIGQTYRNDFLTRLNGKKD